MDEIAPAPWKNGRGTTRELAQRSEQGQMVWRLSFADIAQDGAFSTFPGLSRIHTIATGHGLKLSGTNSEYVAKPLKPVEFDGGLILNATLTDGPCQAFNVIFNPQLTQAQASIVEGESIGLEGGEKVLFVLAGQLDMGSQGVFGVQQGLVLDAPATGVLSDDGVVLVIQFTPI
ncbi:HutD/Ves family protein [Parasedimentitalea denitrificans]|uniref:HutD/Ves family protein n=1 Tax=Parasedimentitalea denitrificans TaxID=2211118 RepID=UPI0034E2FFFA